LQSKDRLPNPEVQPFLNRLIFSWADDRESSIRLRNLVWETAQWIADIAATTSKKPIGRSTRELMRLEKKLRTAARDYAFLSSRVEGMTPHAADSIRGYADEIKYLLASSAKPKQLAKMNPETKEVVKLITFVKSCTGSRHLRELAHILYVAYEERGVSRSRLSAESLDTLYRNHVKRNLQKLPV
jgi:hypothetical protein